MPYRLTVIGTGYLGITHAACMADLGYDVLGLDIDADKIRRLNSGDLPIHEPGLEPVLRRGTRIRPPALHHLLRRGRGLRRRALRLRGHSPEARRVRRGRVLHGQCDHLAGPPSGPRVPGRRQVHGAGGHRRTARRHRSPSSRRPASRPSWPGTPSSCARASPWRTRSTPTASCSASAPSGRRRCCGRSTSRWARCPWSSPTSRRPSWSSPPPTPSWPPRSPSSTRWPRSARRPTPTCSNSRTPCPTTTASAAVSSTRASASAAAACPRTSGRSWPARESSARTRR